VRRVSNTLAIALAALLLAFGVAACGGGDDSDSTTEASGQQQSQADSASQGGEAGSGESDSSSGDSADGDASESHNDSGGGSGQFKVKGGDNSVQEFGEEANAEEFDAAAVALHDFLDARAEGDWEATCEYVASSVTEAFEKLAEQAKQIEGTSCSDILENLTNPAAIPLFKEEAAKANVGSLRVDDEKAFVIYTGTKGTVMAIPMANEDGEWKVASLAGTPLS
jgi:hypothetical protein